MHNEAKASATLIKRLLSGENVALVSDAGTPLVSDPGAILISRASAEGIPITCIPGPSSLTAFLSVAGIESTEFIFSGFFPRTLKDKHRVCRNAQQCQLPAVFFESAKRILDTLKWIHNDYGIAHLVVAKELTKSYEHVWRGSFEDVLEKLAPSVLKGEFLFSCELRPHAKNIEAIITGLQAHGLAQKDILRFAVDVLELPRNEVYRLLHHD